MKKDIHPKINTECKVTCACGNSFVTISTLPSIKVEICSSCHPLFTGQQKFVDTEGRIDKFNKKVKEIEQKKQQKSSTKKAKKTDKTKEQESTKTAENTNKESLKDILKKLKAEEEQNTTNKSTE